MSIVEAILETIRRAFPWAVGLPLLPKLLLSIIVLAGAFFVLALLWTPDVVPTAQTSREPLRKKLLEHLYELDAIESRWEQRYADVDDLARRMSSVLSKDYPESALAISAATRLPSAKETARVVRNEARKILDRLDVAQ